MIHIKLSSKNCLIMNISSLDQDFLEGRVFNDTTYSKETSTIATLVDGRDGNDGGGGWHMRASTLYGCDGRGGAYGWHLGESADDAWNKTDVGGG